MLQTAKLDYHLLSKAMKASKVVSVLQSIQYCYSQQTHTWKNMAFPSTLQKLVTG